VAAEAAIAKVADELGLGVRETAWGILSIASESMVKAVHEITIAQGLNPQESTLVAGGGAAGINIMQIANELGSQRVILPKVASALSASGMHFADIVKEEAAALITSSESFAAASVDKVLAELEAALDQFASRFRDSYPDYDVEFGVEARYQSQIWTIDLPLPTREVVDASAQARLFEAFHDLHERILAVRDPGSTIEFLNWRARVTVRLPRATKEYDAALSRVGEPPALRTCYFGEVGAVETPVFKPAQLIPGTRLQGPAIIEEPTTTLVVYPGMAAEVSNTGNYLLHIRNEA
jgi:N-methylhydantoinase A